MKALIRVSLLAGAVVALTACGQHGNDAAIQIAVDGPSVETVNGQKVPQALLDAFARAAKIDLGKPEEHARALKALTDSVLLAQEAKKDNFASDPEFAADVEIARLQGLAAASLRIMQRQANLDDSVVRAEYERIIKAAGGSEYDFSQLVFATEDEALKASGEAIQKPFSEVFDEYRKGALDANAYNRIRVTQMPPALAQALPALKPGETTRVPLHTDLGWYVVHMNAVNPYTPPEYDKVKDEIRATLLGKIAVDRVQKLRESATITMDAAAAAAIGARTEAPAPAAAQ